MKICFVLPAYPWKPNGGFRTVYEHANQLVARGRDVTVMHARRLTNWPPPRETQMHWREISCACWKTMDCACSSPGEGRNQFGSSPGDGAQIIARECRG